MTIPFVSIIVPIYGAEQYISKYLVVMERYYSKLSLWVSRYSHIFGTLWRVSANRN